MCSSLDLVLAAYCGILGIQHEHNITHFLPESTLEELLNCERSEASNYQCCQRCNRWVPSKCYLSFMSHVVHTLRDTHFSAENVQLKDDTFKLVVQCNKVVLNFFTLKDLEETMSWWLSNLRHIDCGPHDKLLYRGLYLPLVICPSFEEMFVNSRETFNRVYGENGLEKILCKIKKF